MKCPNCQAQNPEGMNFCGKCATELNKVIDSHPDTYKKPESYTPKHLADKILQSKNSIIGERKFVTVLFADVANYTSMSEKLDPEDVHQIMDGCFKALMDEIHEYKGTINQFTGDGVMALFGAPLALEDHAQDACHAALAIQKSMKAYSKVLRSKYDVNFQMRIGINSGSVVVGAIGDDLRMDYTAVGDTTNLAARMENKAKPGTVLVSPNTYKKVSQQFEFKSLGEMEIKGKEEPLEVYGLVKEKVYRPRLGHERQIYSEMVGRDNDLNKLDLQVTKAVNGEGSVVNIIGEAGIGKSRLIAELKNRDIMKQVVCLEGRAISIGRNLSFHPIIDLLKHWAGISEEDTETISLGKLETAIRSVSQQDADEIIPFVATLMGMKLTGRYAERVKGIEGEALEKLILKNVKDLVTKSTELTPLVIVIEDLHWADISSIELLESLFRLAETQRVVFINVFRPAHKETGERIIESIKERLSVYYVEINLQPLSERMSETFIDNMLDIKGLHHGIKNKIVQRAGGNPFFIEEVVRSFIDEGAVVVNNGNFEVTDKIETIPIPHSINDVLMARIDRLEDETRDLIKVASVIGRNFFYRILSQVAQSVQDIDNRLSHLKEIQIIRERRRMEELEYLFKHALAQEVAYESILHQKRKEIHLEVAKSIESVFKERLHDFYGMLALHYNNAEDETKAEEYLIKAGEEAFKSSASSEALNYYKKALNLYIKKYGNAVDPDKISLMEKNIAVALYNKGQFVEAVNYFDNALVSYWGMMPRHILPMLFKFAKCFIGFLFALYFPSWRFKNIPTERDNDFIKLFYMKCEMFAETDPERFFFESFLMFHKLTSFDLTKVHNGTGMFAGISGVFSYSGISFKLSRKVLDFVRDKVNQNDVRSRLYFEMVELMHNYLSGDFNIVKGYDSDLLERSLNKGEIYFSTVYVGFHGYLSLGRGNFNEAENIITKLCEIAEVYDHDLARALCYEVTAKTLIQCRNVDEALPILEKGVSFSDKTGLKLYFSCFNLYIARIYADKGDIKSALNFLSKVKQYKKYIEGMPYYKSVLLLCQLTIELRKLKEVLHKKSKSEVTNTKKRAFKFGKKAISCSRKILIDQIDSYKLMGNYHWLIGKQNKAFKLWNKAIKKGEELGARPNLSRTYFEIGKALLDPKCKYKEWNGTSAQEYLKKARTMFQEMDLQYDLDELDKIAASN